MESPLVESSGLEAQNAVVVAEEARQRAHGAQMTQSVTDAMTGFFATQTEKERFISTQRIPFICADIREIKDTLREIVKFQAESIEKLEEKLETKFVTIERFSPVEKIALGLIGIVALSVVVGVLQLVIKSHS